MNGGHILIAVIIGLHSLTVSLGNRAMVDAIRTVAASCVASVRP